MVYLRVLFTFFIACCRGVKYCDFYFAPIEEAKYFDDRVCVFVYLSDLYQFFFMHVTYVRCLVLLWLRCDTLCTSGLMDDVIFEHNGPYAWIPM